MRPMYPQKDRVEPGADTLKRGTDLDWQGSVPRMSRFFGRLGLAVPVVDATFDLLTLSLLPGVPPRTAAALRVRGPLASILGRPEAHADVLPEAARQRLRSGEARRAAEVEAERARRAGVLIVGRDEAIYPRLLRESFDPPLVLYVRGSLAAGDEPAVAIVGARAATPAGVALASVLARALAGAGITIVSGFARGIDTAAHKGALEPGGRTVAVLGSGLDHPYPPENAALVASVAERGAVVSELPMQWGPRPGQFPRRNRIIAAWGRGVVVVEAGQKSGALITAALALDAGREVMAVPGHPDAPNAVGTNALIRDGARLVRDAVDVAEELGVEIAPRASKQVADDGAGLLASLTVDKPATLEELADRSGRSLPELLAELTRLELSHRVRRLPGPLYVRS